MYRANSNKTWPINKWMTINNVYL